MHAPMANTATVLPWLVARLVVGGVMGGDLGGVRLWGRELDVVHERFVHRFSRSEPWESALAYMRGLIAPLQRENGWPVEEAGLDGPDRIQRMLNRIEWDAEEVLDDVREYVVDHLGGPDPPRWTACRCPRYEGSE